MARPAYDCSLCYGASKREKRDCAECGGTGWRPPIGVEPACTCDDCGRNLWKSSRGPKWFENITTNKVLCEWCIKEYKHIKLPRRRERVVRASEKYL